MIPPTSFHWARIFTGILLGGTGTACVRIAVVLVVGGSLGALLFPLPGAVWTVRVTGWVALGAGAGFAAPLVALLAGVGVVPLVLPGADAGATATAFLAGDALKASSKAVANSAPV